MPLAGPGGGLYSGCMRVDQAKRPRWTAIALGGLWSLLALDAQGEEALGHLQIPVPPGIIAELDGRLSARSQDPSGVIFRDLSPGAHRLTLRRTGSVPQTAVVRVTAGAVTVHTPQPWRAAPRPEAETPTGMVIIQTLPVEATVKAPSLGWPELTKTRAPIQAVTPAGNHRVTVCDEFRCIDYRLNIAAGRLRSVLVDLDRAEVVDLSAVHASQWAQHRRTCEDRDGARAQTACWRACELDATLQPWSFSTACARLLPEGDDGPVAVPAANPETPVASSVPANADSRVSQ